MPEPFFEGWPHFPAFTGQEEGSAVPTRGSRAPRAGEHQGSSWGDIGQLPGVDMTWSCSRKSHQKALQTADFCKMFPCSVSKSTFSRQLLLACKLLCVKKLENTTNLKPHKKTTLFDMDPQGQWGSCPRIQPAHEHGIPHTPAEADRGCSPSQWGAAVTPVLEEEIRCCWLWTCHAGYH